MHSEANINIPDKKLNRIVHRILKKQDSDPITQEEMDTISSINIFDQGVKDLTLEELDITNLSLTWQDGFTSLATLINLKTLWVSNTILDSITFVLSTVNLSKIKANNCKVTDLKPLQVLLDKKLQDSSYSFKSQIVLLDK